MQIAKIYRMQLNAASLLKFHLRVPHYSSGTQNLQDIKELNLVELMSTSPAACSGETAVCAYLCGR